MAVLRENLNTLLNENDRPIKEQIGIQLCKFAYGPTGCKCALENLPACENVMFRAERIYSIVEKDVNVKAKAKRKAINEKAAAKRARRKLAKRLGVGK